METKQIIINYLNNLVVEAAKIEPGDYSSLSVEKFHPPSSLTTTKNKVLRGEIDYSEVELNLLDNQEKLEKKLTQVVNVVVYYVEHLKGGSGQPDEAQEILKNFAGLLKEEIVSEARELGKIIYFIDLPSECQNKLNVRSWTSAQSLIDGKSYILEFIRSSNDIGAGSKREENKTNDSSAQDELKTEPSTDEEKVNWLKKKVNSLKTTLLGSESLMELVISGLQEGSRENYWLVPGKEEEIYVKEFIEKEIKNEKLKTEAKDFFAEVGSETLKKVTEFLKIKTALINAQKEVINIVTRISGANSFSDTVGDDFQRLDELENKELPALISKKNELQGKEVDYSLVEEIMSPVRNREAVLLPLVKEYYIKEIESLNRSDEEINSLIGYEDWREVIQNRTSIINIKLLIKLLGLTEIVPKNSETDFKKTTGQEQKSSIKTPKPKSSLSKSEIVIAGVIVVVVVGAVAAGIWKWLQNRRRPKKIEKENIRIVGIEKK